MSNRVDSSRYNDSLLISKSGEYRGVHPRSALEALFNLKLELNMQSDFIGLPANRFEHLLQ